MSPTERWLAVALAAGPAGLKHARTALSLFGTPEAVLAADPAALEQRCGFKPELARRMGAADSPAFRIETRLVAEQNVRLIAWDDPAYPERLRDLPSAPLLLYAKGIWPPPGLMLAVVGTRTPSRYGMHMTRALITGLARLDPAVTILSGLARGIDGVAHEAALEAKLNTVAVLGNGLNRVYPPDHVELAQRMQAGGALLSEFPMTAPPLAQNFPIRNRIIAGLAHAILIVEAGEQSGSLITAGLAQTYGRRLLALPANADQAESRGTNRLLQSRQAQMVLEPRDILQALTGTPPEPLAKGPVRPARKRAAGGKSGTKGAGRQGTVPRGTARIVEMPLQIHEVHAAETPPGRILSALAKGPQHPDELAQATGLSIEQMLGLLLELELAGAIVQTSEHTFTLP